MKIPGPFVPLPRWPWLRALKLPRAARELYAYLCWKANEKDQKCTVKIATMQEWLESSERQTRRSLQSLTDAGLVIQQHGLHGDHFTVIIHETKLANGRASIPDKNGRDASRTKMAGMKSASRTKMAGMTDKNGRDVVLGRDEMRARASETLKETLNTEDSVSGFSSASAPLKGAPPLPSVPLENEHPEPQIPLSAERRKNGHARASTAPPLPPGVAPITAADIARAVDELRAARARRDQPAVDDNQRASAAHQ